MAEQAHPADQAVLKLARAAGRSPSTCESVKAVGRDSLGQRRKRLSTETVHNHVSNVAHNLEIASQFSSLR